MLSKQNTGHKDGQKSDKNAPSVDQIKALDHSGTPEVDMFLPLSAENDYKSPEVPAISPDVYNPTLVRDNSPLTSQGDTNIRANDIYQVDIAEVHGSSLAENSQVPVDATILVNRIATGYYGNYKILELIGQGGSSDVYKAIRESVKTENPLNPTGKYINKTVACKVLLDRLLDKEEHYKRFLNEANVAKRLSHPNIIDVYDAGEVGGRPFLILDYLEGTALSDTYDKTGGLPIHRALPIFLQISDALGYAHMRHIIHRDLKPSNIMLTKNKDSNDFVKVVDFGISKIISETTVGSTKLTKTGEIFGTPIYMSPEQCRGDLLIDARSDIYSFGILMYEVLTGHPPFEGSNMSLLFQHTQEMPKGIKDIDPDIRLRQRVENIIFRCLEKAPDARYQKMDEVKHDLESAIATGASGSKLIAGINHSLSQFTRKANAFLAKPLTTRQWLAVGAIIIMVAIGVTMYISDYMKAEETMEIKSFLKDVPAAERAITWAEPDAPAYARDSRLFHEMENQLMAKEKLLRAFGDMQTETNFEYIVKLGNFYLSAGALGLADEVFNLAEKLANSLKLSDTPESYEEVADLELSRANCALNRSNYESCIAHASKSIKLHETYKRTDNDFFISKVIPGWELVGRAASAQHNLFLANKAFFSIYDLATKNDYFKRLAERNVFSFARASDFLIGSGNIEKGKTLLTYAMLGWERTSDHLNEGIALNKLGLIYLKSNELKKAIEIFDRSMDTLTESTSVDCNKILAKVLLNKADAYQAAGYADKATDCRKEAKKLWYAPHLSQGK